ncbi:2-hydroxychromene-2-carboxylate isomerase [Novosphingobium kunmingense]|uniref:2-hydroxychromene-2-carboxylate isomerase n=1 Tax=Novosphingobium kunmingense TaxID=1211806 RepID=A0A2N0HJQ3_9SPHN|nr:2-hydroxychromene-2-carboxylate isomerase [Novosphingobium kunmingense]PKB19163.1 2-hydroxychromene-2-carboxylate isomerase [Novosphingobium kunmingense]
MVTEIEFLYDFGSPNAYFVHRAIPPIEAAGKVRFRFVPVLLGGIFKATGNQSPMQAYGHIAAKRDYDFLEIRRFMARHGITAFQMNPNFPVNTLLAMRGAVAAEGLGCAATYVEAMFAGLWEKGLKLDDPVVWAQTVAAAGLDAEALGAATQDSGVKARLVANTEAAVARGVFGIPSFFLGDQLYFGKDRLRDVVEAAGG